MEARGFALMATTDSCPEFVLRWWSCPGHFESDIHGMQNAIRMRNSLQKGLCRARKAASCGWCGRLWALSNLHTKPTEMTQQAEADAKCPGCGLQVADLRLGSMKQLCWTWVTEGFWRFQLTDCTRNGAFEEANPFHFLGVSEVTGAIWRDAAQRSFRRDSRLLRTLLGLSRWETMGNILILSSSASVQWMEMTGMLRIVSSCKVWLHSTRFRTTCSVCQFPGAPCSSKGGKRRGPFVQKMPKA